MPSTFTSSIVGFIAAIILYSGVLVGMALYLAGQQEWIERYTSKKDSFMDIVLVARPQEKPKSTPKVAQVKQPTQETKPEPKPKDSTTKSAQQKPTQQTNVRDLFSSIDTSKLNKVADIPTPKPKEQSRLKPNDSQSATKELPQKKASSLVAGMEFETASQEQSSTGIYDEYRGRITELLQGHWNETPDTTAGAEGTVLITIDTFGNFSYSIERLSYNNTFNAKLRDFLERMKSINFPPSPENNGMRMNITFKDEMELQ
jgi:protein TonB